MNRTKINTLLFTENLFSSSFITVIGTLGGIGFFYAFNPILSKYLGLEGMLNLHIVLDFSLLFFSFISSVILIFFSTIPVFIYANMMKSEDILQSIGSGEMDIVYDEKALFNRQSTTDQISEEKNDSSKKGRKRTKKIKRESSDKNLFQDPITESNIRTSPKTMRSLFHLMGNKRSQSQNKRRKMKVEPKLESLYENIIKTKEKKIPLITYLYLLAGLAPLIPFLILWISEIPSVGDNLRFIGDLIRYRIEVFEFLTILTATFIPTSLMKIFIVNRPSRLARISKSLSRLFLGSRSFICGLEVVRRKQFRKIIIIITIFSSLLTYANVYSISSANQIIIMNNLSIGADIRANPLLGNSPVNFSSTTEFTTLKNSMMDAPIPDNSFSFKDIQIVYEDTVSPDLFNYAYKQIYTDIDAYYEMITDHNKFDINKQFLPDLKEIISYNLDQESNQELFPKVIVNQKFTETFDLQIGDSFIIHQQYLNLTTSYLMEETFDVEIGAIMEYLPGIYYTVSDPFLVFDVDYLTQGDSVSIGTRFWLLFDIHLQTSQYDQENAVEVINNIAKSFYPFDNLQFYDNSWSSFTFKMASSGISRVFSILHFEMILLGILMAVSVGITILSFHEENKYFNGILLARGFGTTGILKLIISEIFVLFILSFLTGLSGGILISILFLLIRRIIYPNLMYLKFSFFFSPVTLFGIIGFIAVFSFGIFYTVFKLNSRKSISRYFQKF
jgi:hypothetical protein